MNARMNPAMFNRQSYAGGGIVAFAGQDGSEVEDEELTEEEKALLAKSNYIDPNAARQKRQSDAWKSLARDKKPYLAEDFRADFSRLADPVAAFFTMRDARALDKAKRMQTADSPLDYDLPAGVKSGERMAPRLVTEKTDTPPSTTTTTSTSAAPVTPPPAVDNKGLKAVTPPQKDIYELEADNLAKLKERFGVKQQPNVESDKMITDLKQKIMSQREDQGLEALGKAMAKGAQGKKWYQAAAGFGEGYFDTTAQQRKLNNEQDQAFTNLQLAKEKEDDARRRGDVKSVQEAVERTRKAEIDAKNAESNRIQAMKPSQFEQQIKLFKEDPKLYAQMYPKENPLVVAAAKEYFEKEQLYKKDYPTVQDYLAAKGLTMGGGSAAPSGPATPPQAAIDALKKDPKLKKQFDDKYGPGASNRYLG
jgi:hypothetical protein